MVPNKLVIVFIQMTPFQKIKRQKQQNRLFSKPFCDAFAASYHMDDIAFLQNLPARLIPAGYKGPLRPEKTIKKKRCHRAFCDTVAVLTGIRIRLSEKFVKPFFKIFFGRPPSPALFPFRIPHPPSFHRALPGKKAKCPLTNPGLRDKIGR
ncbi:MAG TPA: hypothetical protein H9694_00620 [Firmicutes bacterium]|nr:hypothetical protein [Bacillota bacterium]